MEKTNETLKEDEGLCPSMYSFHSSPEEKNKLLFSLTQYGLETTVDRVAKKDRIRQWIQNSVIDEEEEFEEEIDEENIKIHDNQNGPIGERVKERGPISESKVRQHRHRTSRKERRVSTMKHSNGVYKPPVDPRIPLDRQRQNQNFGSENVMEETVYPHENSTLSNGKINGFDITKALPFQNVKISNSLTSSESAFSSDSSVTIKHKINVQHPQAENVNINGTSRERYKYKT